MAHKPRYATYTVRTAARSYVLLVKPHTAGWVVKVDGDTEDDARLYNSTQVEEAIAAHCRTHATGDEVIRSISPAK